MLANALQSGGRLVVLSPNNPALFGSLDKSVGHLRRFTDAQLRQIFEQAGLTVEKSFTMNKAGAFAWWFNSKVLGSEHIGRLTLKVFDLTVWLWKHIDRLLPWNGLSIVVTGRKK